MQNVRFAGFWIRFAANLIDSFIVGICSLVVIVPIIFALGVSLESMETYGNNDMDPQAVMAILLAYGAIFLTAMAANWLYFAMFESGSRQATPGKMAVGVKVIGPQGERISFGRATGRTFAKVISGMICNFGYIMAGFTEYKQALHDMMASTYVIYNNPYEAPAEYHNQSPPPTPGT